MSYEQSDYGEVNRLLLPIVEAHDGVLLKSNVKGEWWRSNLQERDDMVALDAAILMHPKTWEASGHLEGFTDPADFSVADRYPADMERVH